ncbi:MAG: transaldolase [Alphaproteobacteria bacterium]|nr:transaldolase [Alphaproteobacteria bacterium]
MNSLRRMSSFKSILGGDRSSSPRFEGASSSSSPPSRVEIEFDLHPKLKQLSELHQSVWWDSLGRAQLRDGSLAGLIALGVTGVTSNPVIFEQAILSNAEVYEEEMVELLATRRASAMTIYETLAIRDVQDAADLLLSVYEETDGFDGFVSFEVSPDLAHRSRVTIEEAHRLAASINRPNLMIKIPATRAGLDAIRVLTADGLNINVTLIFDRQTLQLVTDAFMSGLEKRANLGKPIDRISSVASFFVSRIDSAIDPLLQIRLQDPSQNRAMIGGMIGQVAISNAKLAWQDGQAILKTPRWQALAALGAKPQRLLWASTGTKNPDYTDLHYVETLVGGDSVNTMPPSTLNALLDHGQLSQETLCLGLTEAEQTMQNLAELGIDFSLITNKLSHDGIRIFVEASERLLKAINRKQAALNPSGKNRS